ncbi:hypothetical protein BH24ACI3_BH24ACI3_11840 [soil metagenome]
MKLLNSLLIVLVVGGITFNIDAQRVPQKQSPPPPPVPKPVQIAELYGDVDGRTYSNRFFGFKLHVPDKFTIMDREDIKIYTDAGVDMIKAQDVSGSSKLDEAVRRSINVLVITKLPPGTPGNSAVEFVAAKQAPGVTSKMVLAETLSVMTATGSFKRIGSSYVARFGGISFDGVDFESTSFGAPLRHRSYITMIKGYTLLISITQQLDSNEEEFEGLLKTITKIN